jgi:hypothetical protein
MIRLHSGGYRHENTIQESEEYIKWKVKPKVVKLCTVDYINFIMIMCRIYAIQELWHRKTLLWLRNSRRSDVFSVPCPAVPSRAVNESLITLPRLASLPGNSYKHLDDARVGKGRVTASAVMSRVNSDATKCFPSCQIQGFIGVRSNSSRRVLNSSKEFSRVNGSSQPRKIISEDEELMCE